jgi:peptidoglycan/xylan/chitin deacetylase (PgdA/CDA1 family)
MRAFLVCIHDATPAYARETSAMLGDLAPLIGCHLSLGVVPNWNREWHLAGHPDYCRLIRERADELLLHGYFHKRQRGWGPATWLAEGSDEMNGLNAQETRHLIERGQSVLTDAFGAAARGFLAPAWQAGHVRAENGAALGVDYSLGFFALRSRSGRRIPLATWTWDCGRWRWLGNVGQGFGRVCQSLERGVPTLAIHPRDIERGFWPQILRLIENFVEAGYEPSTPARLLEASNVEAAA